MALQIVPPLSHPTTYSHIAPQDKGAPSNPASHDTLRVGVGVPANATEQSHLSSHPLEARLRAWEATQESARMEILRRTFGMAEPIRQGMELAITRSNQWQPMALRDCSNGLSSIHEDILCGRENTVTWDEIFAGEEHRQVLGIHDEMERKLKM